MKTETKAYLSLAVVCLIWGTTYLFMRIGVADFPPFLFSGVRQLGAGLLLWLSFPLLKKKIVMDRSDILKQIAPALLLIAAGNGGLTWAERYIPSGLAALIASMLPVYVAIINVAMKKGKSDWNPHIASGLLLGFVGVLLIFRDNLASLANPGYLGGILAAFAGSLSWALGTIFIKKNTSKTDPFTNAAIQFTIGGIALLIVSFFSEDYRLLKTMPAASLGSLIYLILLGSVLGYLCYLYAIKHLPVGLVSTYAYINPFIALSLGYVVLQEKITWITMLAFITTISGVYWINAGHKKAALKTQIHG
jgi:drug/metabolite transporter (DMT)-like permease